MPTLTIATPNEKQKLFLLERHKFVGFGGARGGGKSWVVRTKAKLLCLRYAGIKCMIVRKTYPELTANHINPLVQELKCYAPKKRDRIASYNDAKKTITFPNGSCILFRYCDTLKDVERFQGTEADILFVDEATHQTEEVVKKLIACVRGVNPFPKRVYFTANPGGVGHGWFKRLFIDRNFKRGENPDDYVFIQSRVTDNVALMRENPDYISQLEALPPKLREMWLDGSWEVNEGAFFEEFKNDPDHYIDRRYTHVIEPFEIPDGWKIYRSFDWGYNKPFSCCWWAVDYDGVAYHILEFYGCARTQDGEELANTGVKWAPPKVFAEIARIEREHRWLAGKKIIGIADPAIWDAETGESIADTAARHGVFFQAGDNKRIAGWLQMHYRLAFDENGFPMMYVFKNCKSFIRTIPLLMFDEHKPEDLDTDGEDHIADAARYFLMSRPIKPRQKAVDDGYTTNPLNLFLDIPKESLSHKAAKPPIMIIGG